jgi:hypothetical protein
LWQQVASLGRKGPTCMVQNCWIIWCFVASLFA